MYRIIAALIIGFVLSGCNLLPESLRISERVELLPFDEVGDMDLEPTNYQALWGGVIASTSNYAERTLVEVIYFPLDEAGRPQITGESLGRFRVYVGDFVDPFVYRPGRSVTVLGTLGVREKGLVGYYPYDYTVLHCIEMHLWSDMQQVNMPPQMNRFLQTAPEFSFQ